MSYTKKIVCLANSWKDGGFCFAGKDVDDNGYGNWIRPVSNRTTQEITDKMQTCADGTKPQLLDVVVVPLREHAPTNHQTENYLIANGVWEKAGRLTFGSLPTLLDRPDTLWENGDCTYLGAHNQMHVNRATKMPNSLYLIKPQSIAVIIHPPYSENGNSRIYAEFEYNKTTYKLNVTDPAIKARYDLEQLKPSDKARRHPLSSKDVFLCVSLAEEFVIKNCCYKLVAGVFHND